ncbi:MerR family transcriptional regulator [Humidisolicoccus flavus]|uniref:MerR family transcriptional regulator n=1 Tax=Humidisolicoccus flavus TaxID=3111414 RepID=UPI00324315A1
MHSGAENSQQGETLWTIGAVAARLGVTERTLRHWESSGVASASERSAGGYRQYAAADVARLHRVVLYRELGFSLEDIRAILDSEGGASAQALRDQRAHLLTRITEFSEMITAIDQMLHVADAGLPLTAEEQVEIFGAHWKPEWAAAAEERWGDTEAWAEHAENASKRSASEWQRFADETARLGDSLAAAMHEGVMPGSTRANELAEAHRAWVSQQFSCSHAMQVCLGRLYTDSGEDGMYYNAVAPNLNRWVRSAIEENARAHGVDPDTAKWE